MATDTDEVGTLVAASATAGTGNETLSYDVHELHGSYYAVVVPHDATAIGQDFNIQATVTSPGSGPAPITPAPTSFSTPPSDPSVQTLILTNQARVASHYPGDPAAAALPATLNALAADPNVHGVVVNLDSYPAIHAAYTLWDNQATNPQAANYVAWNIKSLIYSLAPAYPNLKYLVIAGSDPIVPSRRIADSTLLANERNYQQAGDARINAALTQQYYLTDDYYAGLVPLPFLGGDVYIPQVAIGRLVEKPQEITTAVHTFLNQPEVTPSSALVTGYEFLKNEATAVNASLTQYGISNSTTLINDAWTANDFRTAFFGQAAARGINSLNSHFTHNSFYPNDGTSVYADEVANDNADYRGALIFSVGCHSGLNVPDAGPNPTQADTDWAQAFSAKGATFLGNTGYGYADSDVIAYSAKLMVNFVQQLGGAGGATPTVGGAMLAAKQDYFNSLGSGLVQQLRSEGARRDDPLRVADVARQRAQPAGRRGRARRAGQDQRPGRARGAGCRGGPGGDFLAGPLRPCLQLQHPDGRRAGQLSPDRRRERPAGARRAAGAADHQPRAEHAGRHRSRCADDGRRLHRPCPLRPAGLAGADGRHNDRRRARLLLPALLPRPGGQRQPLRLD